PGLAWRDVQVNAPHRQDRQAREERNPIVPTRADKRRAGDDFELRHGGEELDFVARIRAYAVRMQLLQPEDIGINFTDHPGNTGCVMLSVGANTTMDIVGRNDETRSGGGCTRGYHLSHPRPHERSHAVSAARASALRGPVR